MRAKGGQTFGRFVKHQDLHGGKPTSHVQIVETNTSTTRPDENTTLSIHRVVSCDDKKEGPVSDIIR